MTWNVPKPTARFAKAVMCLFALCLGVSATATSAQHEVVDGFQFPGLMIGEPLGLPECPWKELPFIGDDPATAPIVERRYLNDGTQDRPCYAQVASIGSGIPLDGRVAIAYPSASGAGDTMAVVVLRNQIVLLLASLRYVDALPPQRMDQLIAQFGAPMKTEPSPAEPGDPESVGMVFLQAEWALPGELVLNCKVNGTAPPMRTAQVCRLLPRTLPDGVQLDDLLR